MSSLLRSMSYFPILKWKLGERQAIASQYKRGRSSALCPVFELPPSGDFDHEKGRPLKPLEHLKLFGARLHQACGRSIAFVDAAAVDNDVHKLGLGVHPLTELLERSQAASALACPVTSLRHSQEYQSAVRRFVERYKVLPVALRVDPLDDMEDTSFSEKLDQLLSYIACERSRVVLILDFGPKLGSLGADQVDGFVEAVMEKVYSAIEQGPWLKIATVFSAFPSAVKIKQNSVATFTRTDWLAYRLLLKRESAFQGLVAYGDYAVDSAPVRINTGRASPSAQFRFTGTDDYVVVKGVQAKKPIGYAAIVPVAEILCSRPEFVGANFCDGDAFVGRLASTPGVSTGNASTWRWAGTDHHFARVLADLDVTFGRRLPAQEMRNRSEEQADLFLR